jgi:hypothetical protein
MNWNFLRTFDVLALHGPDDTKRAQSAGSVRSQVLEGFEINLEQLFHEPTSGADIKSKRKAAENDRAGV